MNRDALFLSHHSNTERFCLQCFVRLGHSARKRFLNERGAEDIKYEFRFAQKLRIICINL